MDRGEELMRLRDGLLSDISDKEADIRELQMQLNQVDAEIAKESGVRIILWADGVDD